MSIKESLQDYALLRTDTFSLLLPRSQINSVEHIEDRKEAEEKTISQAKDLRVAVDDGSNAFVSLSEHLSILPFLPKDRFVQTTWAVSPNIHWCWTEVKWLNRLNLQVHAIPPILHTDNMPVSGLVALNDGKIAFVCDAQDLLSFVTEEGGIIR